MSKQSFPNPAVFKSQTKIASEQAAKKKSSNQPLMSDEHYPAHSFKFVQPSKHTSFHQGHTQSPTQATLPSFSATFGQEDTNVNCGPADGNSEGHRSNRSLLK